MIKIYPFCSSSSGNTYCIRSNDQNILVDAGVSYKTIKEGLDNIGLNSCDINYIFVTHEHIDHIKGLPVFCKNNKDVKIIATTKTAIYLQDLMKEKNINACIKGLNYNEKFTDNGICVLPFEISHDAVMPCGYNIELEDKHIAFATDLGFMSDEILYDLEESDFAILEANYDKTMLDFGKYPYELKRRIKSNLGHLSNDDSAQTIKTLVKKGNNNFLLAHLSYNNNTVDIAKDTVSSTLLQADIDPNSININVATKNLSCEVYEI